MGNRIIAWVLKKVFIRGFKRIEKQDLVTRALEQCFKVKKLRLVWEAFVSSIITFFEDAIDEAKKAKEWAT